MEKELKQEIIQWDVKSWSKALDFWEKNVDWSKVETALEIGSKKGGLSLWLALKGVQTVCSDVKDTAETARPFHEQHGVGSLITYEDMIATDIPYENHFDVIVFKSVMGIVGINDQFDQQQLAFRQIHKALKKGGKLLFAENLSATYVHQQLRKRFLKWGEGWRYVTMNEMKTLLGPFSSYELKATGVLATFGRSEQQRSALAAMDNLILNNVCPKSWKYIAYGIAEK